MNFRGALQGPQVPPLNLGPVESSWAGLNPYKNSKLPSGRQLETSDSYLAENMKIWNPLALSLQNFFFESKKYFTKPAF